MLAMDYPKAVIPNKSPNYLQNLVDEESRVVAEDRRKRGGTTNFKPQLYLNIQMSTKQTTIWIFRVRSKLHRFAKSQILTKFLNIDKLVSTNFKEFDFIVKNGVFYFFVLFFQSPKPLVCNFFCFLKIYNCF
jgi:hypothetical protein